MVTFRKSTVVAASREPRASILVVGACGWALLDPIRKIRYDLTITAISGVVALKTGGLDRPLAEPLGSSR